MFLKISRILPVVLLVSLLLVLPINLAESKKTITTLDLTTFEGTQSAASDINNIGQVVGVWYEAPPATGPTPVHAFVWQKGVKTNLAPLADQITSDAVSINDIGQIAGFCRTPNPDYPSASNPQPPAYLPHAVMWTNPATIISLETLPGIKASESRDINRIGQVVGMIEEVQFIQIAEPPAPMTSFLVPVNAFLWSQESGMTILDIELAEGEVGCTASGINDQGTVVGYTLTPNENGVPIPHRGFIWNPAAGTTFLDFPSGATLMVVSEINNKEQVIGFWATSSDSNRHGFIWTAKTGFTEIPALEGGNEVLPLEISDNGQVAGICSMIGEPRYPPTFERGFIFDSKKSELISLPPLQGDDASTARGLNNQGKVVGTSVKYSLIYDEGEVIGYRAEINAVQWTT